MEFVGQGLASQDKQCRKVTIFAIAALTEYVNPEIYNYHALLFPQLMKQLNDPNEEVVE